MKKLQSICFVILFLTCGFSSAQTYIFDTLFESTLESSWSPKKTTNDFFSSNDQSFYLRFYNFSGVLTARIYDRKNNTIHFFDVKKSDSYEFFYVNTFKHDEIDPKYRYEFSKLNSTSTPKTIILNIFKKSKSIAKFKLDIEESNENLFPNFNLSFSEPLSHLKIEAPFNLKVLRAQAFHNSLDYKITTIKDLDEKLEIKLPEKLVYKN